MNTALGKLGSHHPIEGHAIVSADGMIATDGGMPDALRIEADWTAFQGALDRSAAVILGRLGHERHPNSGRRRIVVSTRPGTTSEPLTTFWNPDLVSLADLVKRDGIQPGTLAVTGGTLVFDLFLGSYDRFVLSEVHGVVLPAARAFRRAIRGGRLPPAGSSRVTCT
jgi:dihydrofolate reductase